MRLLFLPGILVLLTVPTPAAEQWTQFRGPNGTGISDSKGLPTSWSEKENVAWKTKIHGKGWSSPVVWGKQVWLTTADPAGKERFALCVHRDTGKIIHDLKVFDTPKKLYTFHEFNSHASPTPVIEEGRVYVHFGSAGTACLDTKTGKPIWTRTDLHCDHWRGPGSSPILWGDLLFLTFDGHDKQFVVALNKSDGTTAWKKDRVLKYPADGDLKKGYSTPAVITVDGKPQLVSPSAVGTIAFDPKTGKEIWKVHHGGMNAANPPLYGNGLVYLVTGDGGFGLLAVRPTGSGDVTETHIAWKHNKAAPSRPSPLYFENFLYTVSNDGVAQCLAAKTAEQVWSRRLNGAYVASPVYADGLLYFFDQQGKGLVVDAKDKGKIIATNKLDAGCMATPAFAGKALFVRTKTHLYRIEKK
jgi:outer membrane protein assembly factor BamB